MIRALWTVAVTVAYAAVAVTSTDAAMALVPFFVGAVVVPEAAWVCSRRRRTRRRSARRLHAWLH